MCIYMCVEVVLINILASHLAPRKKFLATPLVANAFFSDIGLGY